MTPSYYYDAAGNLTNIVYPVSPAITLKYDELNRLTNMVDAAGTTRYSYDTVGQLLSEDGPWDADTVSYSFQNRLRAGLSVAAPNASAWTESYTYDAMKRLTNLTSPAGGFGYSYGVGQSALPGSLVRKLSLPGGAYITNAFDSVAHVLSTTLRNSQDAALNAHSYTYSTASQRIRQTRTDGSYVDYTYDGMGQLITAKAKEPGGTTNRLHEQLSYVYDAAGNLNWRTNNAMAQSFGVNAANELTTVSRTAGSTLTVAGTTTGPATNVTVNTYTAELYGDATFAKDGFSLIDGTNTFTAIAKDSYGRQDTNTVSAYLPASANYQYDANGNLLSDGRRFLEYDDENQLVSVTLSNAWRSEFVYDGKMRRRVRKEYTWIASAWNLASEVRYVYDGNLMIQERDGSNLPQVTYTRGKDLSGSLEGAGGIGGLLARTDNWLLALGDSSAHAFYHADGNGNITCLVNSLQSIVARYLYDPYGNVLSQSGPLAEANLYRFSSKEYHPNSGLVYYLYRCYEPSLQRWFNRDPLGDEVGLGNAFRGRSRAAQIKLIQESRRPAYAFIHNKAMNAIDGDGQAILAPVLIGIGIDICLYALDYAACYVGVRWELEFAESQAEANAPDGSRHATQGSQADALTHCIAGCNAAKNPAACLTAARALDFLNDREDPAVPADEMDIANNTAGYSLGIDPNNSKIPCTTLCLNALRGNGLFTFGPRGAVPLVFGDSVR